MVIMDELYKYYSSGIYDKFRLSGGIYFSSPKECNDLFDCRANVVNNLISFMNSFGEVEAKNILSDILDTKDSTLINTNFKDLKNTQKSKSKSKELIDKQLEKVRLLCLTTINSPLMWAYYGDNKGYCIKYDKSVIDNKLKLFINKTNDIYSENYISYKYPPKVDLFNKDIAKSLKKYFYKYYYWKNECEYRYVLLSNTISEIQFGIEVMKSITFGHNMEVDKMLQLYKIIIHNSDYKDGCIQFNVLRKTNTGFLKPEIIDIKGLGLRELEDEIIKIRNK
jgi:hypothetical protein